MTTTVDLAAWGEPPATPAEEALATLLDRVLAEIESGNDAQPEALRRGGRLELKERDLGLLSTVSLVYECAANVWENSVMAADDLRTGTRYSPIDKPSVTGEVPFLRLEQEELSPVEAGGPQEPFPGEYRVVRVLGEGAFGRVLLAEDLNLGWQVALKTLKLPATSTLGPQVLTALRTEAQHLAQLDHPNIVRVHAWREARGEYFLVLQFVAGGSLADRLKTEGVLPWQDAARYVADVGEALVAVHKRDVIHRDIKPDNILWDATRNEAVLTDFGVSARLAEPGTVAGTPMYMAPEAFEGRVSPALDVYSLAATLYRLVTGEHPFAKALLPGLVYQKLQGLPDPDPEPRLRAVPEALERVIRAGMAGRPENRPSMAEFAAQLRATLNQLLTDDLVTPAAGAGSKTPVDLRLMVGRQVQGETYEPLATTRPASFGLSRDMKKVPRPPEQVRVRTGERVRIEVVADKSGYVTVFNVGPTGNLNLLYPDDPTATPSPVEANRPLHVVDVEMTPPAGRERVFAVWSKEPSPLSTERLAGFVEHHHGLCSAPYRASRDMKRIKEAIEQLPTSDRFLTVLELDHIE
ncbi:serine/threonine-protein kinase [Urbifossiella limnaea]|uniref:Serine/threonine-protein kinase PknB n=1 Tax=Urbifossiella limnaea TaxID=2528023 RepID=A0A517XW76_9BACT|nr:serine/threonine-protein kinase [Urbifossiella limnaea]QDU21759.1 Serine/threonine-protein kinase PknB [Urbifossiella limnaea]